MKKLLALILALAMVVSMFAACGAASSENPGTAEPAPTEKSDSTGKTDNQTVEEVLVSEEAIASAKTYAEGEHVKIGYIGWGFADETALMYVREFEAISRAMPNVEFVLNDGWSVTYSAEDCIENIPSLVEAGCQGFIVHSMSAKMVEMFNEYQTYFSLSGEVILDEELQRLCDESPYFVGTVALGDYNGGYAMGEYLAKDGRANIAYTRSQTRNLEENRVAGFRQAMADNNMEALGEYCGMEYVQAYRDYIANYAELDAIVVSNGTGDTLLSCLQTLEAEGVAGEIAVTSICSPIGYEEYFDNGSLSLVMGGEGFEPFICAMLIINAMFGHRIDDAAILCYVDFFPITDSQGCADYAKYFASAQGGLPITDDQILANWYKPNNPDLNNEWIKNWIDTEFNLDAMNAARAG